MFLRIWSNEMESAQFEEIFIEIQMLHRAMKNAIEMVFATSPLLALSTNSWAGRACNSTFLLRVSDFYVLHFRLLMPSRPFMPLAMTALKSSFSWKTAFSEPLFLFQRENYVRMRWELFIQNFYLWRRIWLMTVKPWNGSIWFHPPLPILPLPDHLQLVRPFYFI
jgi:hypothetical protein